MLYPSRFLPFGRQLTAALAVGLTVLTAGALAGPYSAASNDPGNPFDPPIVGLVGGLPNPVFKGWATTVVNYSPSPQPINPSFANPNNFLGPLTPSVVSLGDLTADMIANGDQPGSLVVGFDNPIWNGPGTDFAVFENGFISGGGIFGELAYVEVSTNGTDFVRFPSVSLTSSPVGPFQTFDPTNVYNLVGKHINGWGTPFNLDDLATDPLVLDGTVDLNRINYVRMVDIPGNGSFLDSLGNPIYDPWLTTGSGGADLRGLGVLNVLAPTVAVAPGVSLTFPPRDITLGASATQTITLSNTGSGPLSFVGAKWELIGDPAFLVSPSPSALTSIGESDSLDLIIASKPDVDGPTSATLRILTDALNSPVLEIALQGSGFLPPAHDWEQFAGSTRGLGRQFIDNPHTRLDEPFWTTGPEMLANEGSVVVLPGEPGLVIAWAAISGSAAVKAFNIDTGAHVWTSPPLAGGNTIAFGSWHTAAADAATTSVLIATGGFLYRLDGTDGSIVWQRALNLGGSSDIVNGSVTIGGGRAYISTYGGFAPSGKRLYAVNVSDGTVAWSVQEGGPGSEAPVYVENNLGSVVYTLTATGINARNSTDGNLIWSSTAPLSGSPLSITNAFFGGLTYYKGVLYAPTFNFGGTSELVAVDGTTGALVWKNNSTVTGDSTPVVLGDKVYIVGHDIWDGPSFLAAYSRLDGSQQFKVQLTTASTMWNVSPVAFNDAIAVTLGSNTYSPGAPTGVRLLDPATGASITTISSDAAQARGTPAIGRDGRLYTLRANGGLAAYVPTALSGAVIADLDGSMGSGQTDDRTVTISIAAAYATEMRLAELTGNKDISQAPWVPFQSPTTFEVSAGSGLKTIEVQVRNGSSESAIQAFSIEYFEPTSVSDWQVLHD
jgi:outer membrane protein assembly factor BamB